MGGIDTLQSIQKLQRRCLSGGMELESPVARLGISLIIACLGAALIGLLSCFPTCAVGSGSAANNPNDFYLWSTKSSFTYTFRYDPREADLWMFRSAGGLKVPKHSQEMEKIWTNSASSLLMPRLPLL